MNISSEIVPIIEKLIKNNSETPTIEVKANRLEIDKLGQTISAISNSCLLEGESFGYIIFGIEDNTWEIKGTNERLADFKIGGQQAELYLTTLLQPDIKFEFYDNVEVEGKSLNVIKIPSATHTPVSYKKEVYIRIGANNKLAKDFSEKTRELWSITSGFNYEKTIVKRNVKLEDIFELLDYPTYKKIKNWDKENLEKNIHFIINAMLEDDFLEKVGNGYNIKAIAALLLAKSLKSFNLERKGVRVILYNGDTKSSISKQFEGDKGYGVGFENLIKTIQVNLPVEERAVDGVMKTFEFYPSLIIRELVANAIIHQDLNVKGFETKVEIFQNRVEITNPGKSIIDIWRFYDSNKSRNEKLAFYMRKLKLCEELGSGIDRIVEKSEIENRFTPKYLTNDEYVNVKLFKNKEFEQMTDEDKMNIMFYHCCYCYTLENYMTNTTLRKRFSLDDSKKSIDKITRLIVKAKNKGYIKQGTNKSYIPFWAE